MSQQCCVYIGRVSKCFSMRFFSRITFFSLKPIKLSAAQVRQMQMTLCLASEDRHLCNQSVVLGALVTQSSCCCILSKWQLKVLVCPLLVLLLNFHRAQLSSHYTNIFYFIYIHISLISLESPCVHISLLEVAPFHVKQDRLRKI